MNEPKHLGGRFYFAPLHFDKPGLWHVSSAQSPRRLIALPHCEPPSLVEFPEQTVVVAKDQPQYRPLPAYRYQRDDQGKINFCWRLSWVDRVKVLFTGRLWHQVMTFNQPLQPQLLMTIKPEMPKHKDCNCCPQNP